MGEVVASDEQDQIKLISKRSPDYKLEFINGALSNLTPRGEIVCEFHFESKDRPTEQTATIMGGGMAKFLPFQETKSFTRDVKFGVVMNVSFARDLVKMLEGKIKEGEELLAARMKGDVEHESAP